MANGKNIKLRGTSSVGNYDDVFAQLELDLTVADDLATIAAVFRNFSELLWAWDSLSFNVRRSRESFQFRSVLLVDTFDGEKVTLPESEYSQSDGSPNWARLLTGESFLVNRAPDEVVSDAISTFGSQRRSASIMYVPIEIKGQIAGVLSLQSYTADAYEIEDLNRLTQAAKAMVPAILRCRSEERMKEFLRLGDRLNQVTDTGGVARVVANTAAKLLGWTFMSVHIFDPVENKLQLVLGLQRSKNDCQIFANSDYVIESPRAGISEIMSGPPVLVDGDASMKENAQRLIPFGQELPLSSTNIFAPVRSLNRVVGLLCIQNVQVKAYGPDEVEIARGLADYCGGALERAWAEQNLKQSEASYRLVVENVNDGIVISQDDHFVFFNNRFAHMLGYTTEELQTKTYVDIYSPEGLQILLERTKRRNDGQVVPDRYETVLRNKAGELLPVEANISIIPYQGKNATFAIIRDISERRLAEEKLRKSDEELRTLFNAMTDAIMVVDQDGQFIRHKSGAKKHLPTNWQDMVGRNLRDVFPEERAKYFLQLVRKALVSGQTLNIEYELELPDGKSYWYNTSVSPMTELTVLMVARDITERREADEELFRSNARYKALLDGSEDYIFVLDKELRFVHVNSAIGKRYNAQPEDRIGISLYEMYPDGFPDYVTVILEVFKSGLPATFDDDAVINGQLICTETVISPVFSRAGDVEAVLGISRDVTGRRLSEAALKESEQRYAVAVRGANDGIWDWNLESEKLYLSPRWWAIVGEPDDRNDTEHDPDVWLERIHIDDLVPFKEKINDHISGLTPHLEDEHRIRHSNDEYRWVLCRGLCVRDGDGKAIQMAGSLSDITDRKVAEEKLHYGATHDALTDLPNRACFLDFLEKARARAKRLTQNQAHFAVLFLDMDRFKVVNDSLGHMAGDELIKAMARRLEACVRPGDTVARLGGDEFTILLEGLTHDRDATRVAERIIRELSAPVQISGVAVQSTVSVGIAYDKPDYASPNELLRDADNAMYRAKAAGRNRYQVFDQQMHAKAVEQLHWEADLRMALVRQEFEMYYQPIYNLQTSSLSGFEALIRWHHPEKGLIMPGDFIPLAEETNLIVSIGWWIIEQAAQAVTEWNAGLAKDSLTVSINLSPRQIVQPDVADRLELMVGEAGAKPANIIIEITENVLMDDSPQVTDTLRKLRDAGFRIDLDDFGTGYSSMSYIRRYPLDMLKIDKSFVNDLDTSESSRLIVQAMLDLSNGLHLLVTAEGVETETQLVALKEMNCGYAQGYFFSKPVAKSQTFDIISHKFNLDGKGQI